MHPKKGSFRRARGCVRTKESFWRAEEVCVRKKEAFRRAEEVCVRKKCVSHPSTNQRIKSSVPPSEAMPCVERQ